MIIVSGVLLVSPFVIDRLESVSAGTASVEVRFAQHVIDLGAAKTRNCSHKPDSIRWPNLCAFAHRELPTDRFCGTRVTCRDLAGGEHTAAITHSAGSSMPVEVWMLFREGSMVIRVLTIGLMKGMHLGPTAPSIAMAIGEPLSDNEQYHGLRLAQRCWAHLGQRDRRAISAASENAIGDVERRPPGRRSPHDREGAARPSCLLIERLKNRSAGPRRRVIREVMAQRIMASWLAGRCCCAACGEGECWLLSFQASDFVAGADLGYKPGPRCSSAGRSSPIRSRPRSHGGPPQPGPGQRADATRAPGGPGGPSVFCGRAAAHEGMLAA